MGGKGIGRDTTVVIYGDKNNWWAAYALWVFTLFGHEDVRLLDGGRAKWMAEGRAYTTDVPSPAAADYPVVERDDASIRAFNDDVLAHLGKPMVDVRSPEEYTGERTHMPDYPEEGALRGGHIPGAQSMPWARAAAEDGTFNRREELEAIYQDEKGLAPTDDVVAYCRIGERSSHTWFVLTHLLGFEKVRNYDGSWTEWGNAVRVPIVKGERDPARCRRGERRRAPAGAAGDRRRLRRDGRAGPAAAAARVQPRAARAARALHRPPGAARAGAGVPVAAVPGHRGRRHRRRRPVRLFFQAPAGGPDHPRLRGHPARGARRHDRAEVLAVPDDLSDRLSLADAVSLLRLRGMAAMLGRIKRQVREKAGL